MKNKAFLTILLTLSALVCSGQSFLSKYPKLTDKNLSEFFADWEAYSDSIISRGVKNDALMDMVVADNYAPLFLEGDTCKSGESASPKYHVAPQYIKVERYRMDIDTSKIYDSFPYKIPDLKADQYSVDTITPALVHGWLYLTRDIERKLSVYAGGLKNGEKFDEINKDNVAKLSQYIPVHYGHWGGYWWFESFPLIRRFCYADNLIAVNRRTSWCSGDEFWYVKENGKFVKLKDPVTWWIE